VGGAGGPRPPRARRDLASVATFTIDPDTARDFDDAISVVRDGPGYRAWVHIADVSYYVDAGGAIDLEARQRTSSVYLPLWAEPMLPEALSAGVCSLQEGVPRKCVTAEFAFDGKGRRTSVAFYRSTIHSDHRLTYGFVDEVLAAAGVQQAAAVQSGAATASGDAWTAPVHDEGLHGDAALRDHLLLAWELAAKLRAARFARGALQIGSFEPEFRFDARGQLTDAAERLESPSHSLIEEFMLAANEGVAEFLLKRHAAAIYRVHEPPDPSSADELLHQMEELEVPTPAFPEAGSATAADVAGALRHLSELLPKLSAREHRGRLAFLQLLLRSLKQARYDPENRGHFGLSSSAYLHFTSPIRRYPDLVVHRALLHQLGLGGAELSAGELFDVASRCSTMERTIAKLELTADDIALAFLLERRLAESGWDEVFEGEIIGVIESGLFVHFGGSFEGYLPARALPGDFHAQSEYGTALVGRRTGRRFRLGDAVRVRAVRVDRVTGKVEVALVDALAEDAGEATAGPERSDALTGRRRRR
jgi:ribonuclease R